jgi:hypothetical protein
MSLTVKVIAGGDCVVIIVHAGATTRILIRPLFVRHAL